MTEGRLMTTRQVAEWLSVAPHTVSGWAKSGRVPAIRVSNRWRFDREALEVALKPADPWARSPRSRARLTGRKAS
jgi:excisionase family DNA binding protein